jgi:hypothetical protein
MDRQVPLDNPRLTESLQASHFDAVYIGNRKLGFISPEFRALMLDLWKIKYVQMKRFGDVIRSIPREKKIEHFLNDGDSPDIPIPIYIGYLNQIREMAWAAAGRSSAAPSRATPSHKGTRTAPPRPNRP